MTLYDTNWVQCVVYWGWYGGTTLQLRCTNILIVPYLRTVPLQPNRPYIPTLICRPTDRTSPQYHSVLLHHCTVFGGVPGLGWSFPHLSWPKVRLIALNFIFLLLIFVFIIIIIFFVILCQHHVHHPPLQDVLPDPFRDVEISVLNGTRITTRTITATQPPPALHPSYFP